MRKFLITPSNMSVDKIRVSLGSAAVLDLIPQKFKVRPLTCYIMTYVAGKCSANCGFCPQARSSTSISDKLSRVTWPEFPLSEFLIKLRNLKPSEKFKRICIQTLNYPNNFYDLIFIIRKIKEIVDIEISVAIPPMSNEKLKELKLLGINRVGIALDAASPEIFRNVKGECNNGFYTWEKHFQTLKRASKIFPNNISTHIIVGLGETQKNIINLLFKLKSMNVLPSLFAFTPVKGTSLESKEKPSIVEYRKIQISRYLIFEDSKSISDFTFDSEGKIIHINLDKKNLREIIEHNQIFNTIGCPNCDRPFYTSNPSGPFYNFPRDLKDDEKEKIYTILKKYINF
jgi:biotin synthase